MGCHSSPEMVGKRGTEKQRCGNENQKKGEAAEFHARLLIKNELWQEQKGTT